MARLIKEWMKAKKGICSSDCECLTITWWRCYAEEHLCNCGDWGSTPPVPPVPPVDPYTYSISKESGDYYYAEKLEGDVIVNSFTFAETLGQIWEWADSSDAKNIESQETMAALIEVFEQAVTAWTQEAYKWVYEYMENLYNSLQ